MHVHDETTGFTLIELLVVIGIIGILAAFILIAINPAEIQRKGRDTIRLSDMISLRKAIDATLANNGGPLRGTDSIPFFADSSGTKQSDISTNYVGMDVSQFLSILPDDPQHESGNTTDTVTISDGVTKITKDNMRYFFASNGNYYELNAYLESTSNNDKALNTNDGGDSNTRYEVGSKPGLDLIAGP